MGLEGVELLLECEDEFGITIPDEEASRIETVADLHAAILLQMAHRTGAGGKKADICQTSALFYRLRRALVARGVGRGTVRPGATVGEVLPRRRDVRRAYETMRGVLGPPLPAIKLSDWQFAGLMIAIALAAGGVVAAAVLAHGRAGPWLAGFVIAAGAVVLCAAWMWLDSWARTRLPCPSSTLAALIREHNAAASMWGMELERAEVYARLRAIVSEQLGVNQADVVPSARLVDDLGLS